MRSQTENSSSTLEEITENLVSYSIDRSKMTALLNHVPSSITINRTAVEYEIQLLRILTVGWGIGYYTEDEPLKQTLSESFWNSVRDFSGNLSSIFSFSMSRNFDYFEIIKQRLETYLNELHHQKNGIEPTAAIGMKFAELCGHPNDAMVIWLGSKMFQSVLGEIKGYLSAAKVIKNNHFSTLQPDTQ